MFTGIIQCLGMVLIVKRINGLMRLRIKPKVKMAFKKGESIAVNGVCLTVDDFSVNWFEAFVSPETLRVTNLKNLCGGKLVNLERALVVGDRLGGHLVSGHIDDIAIIKKITPAGSAKILRLEFAKKFSSYFVPKGSVSLDGISLTVNNCGAGFFEITIIPETLEATTAGKWTIGYAPNMEIDLISKHLGKINVIV
jgi:riboflavin synthase